MTNSRSITVNTIALWTVSTRQPFERRDRSPHREQEPRDELAEFVWGDAPLVDVDRLMKCTIEALERDLGPQDRRDFALQLVRFEPRHVLDLEVRQCSVVLTRLRERDVRVLLQSQPGGLIAQTTFFESGFDVRRAY